MSGLGSRLSTYWHTKRSCKWWWCNQHPSADQTHIPCVPVTSLKQKEGVWRAGAPALTIRTGLALAAKLLNAATPGLGTSACHLPMKRHHALAMPAQPDQVTSEHLTGAIRVVSTPLYRKKRDQYKWTSIFIYHAETAFHASNMPISTN